MYQKIPPTNTHALPCRHRRIYIGNREAALADYDTNDLAHYFRARLYVDQYQDCEKAKADSARLAELSESDTELELDIATLCHLPTPCLKMVLQLP